MATFSHLPAELVEYIYIYLAQPDLYAVSQVNKGSHALAEVRNIMYGMPCETNTNFISVPFSLYFTEMSISSFGQAIRFHELTGFV